MIGGTIKRNFVSVPVWILLLGGLAFTSPAQLDPCSLSISQLDPPNSPGQLIGQASAYDDWRQVAVLFGGNNPLTGVRSSSNTWEWNGAAWTLRTSGTPPGRRDAAMAFDSARGVCVLFGGGTNVFESEIPFNDTWEWNGSVWVLRQGNDPTATDRPPPMDFPKMSYDSRRRRIVLLGSTQRVGSNINPVTNTWEWDGDNWSLRATAPPSRYQPAIAYDSLRRVTVVFGGVAHADNRLLNDTWTWDGTNWTLAATGGPRPRDEHAMAFDVPRKVMVMTAGDTDNSGRISEADDIWEWNGQTWSEIPVRSVGPRRRHQMWYDSGEEAVFIFGGTYSVRLDDGSFSHYILDDLLVTRPPGLWIDFSNAGGRDGSFEYPYNTVADAVERATPGCVLHFFAGSKAETITISKQLRLETYNGPVTIGR
jgi:hypothetical protein